MFYWRKPKSLNRVGNYIKIKIMKKKNFKKKLEFKKEVVTNLNDIKGGYHFADTDGCGGSGPISETLDCQSRAGRC